MRRSTPKKESVNTRSLFSRHEGANKSSHRKVPNWRTLVVLLLLPSLLAFFGVIEFEFFGRLNESKQLIVHKNDPSKPLLILAIGPPKTGTTSIQRFSKQHYKKLAEDNVYFLGNAQNFPQGMFTHELCRNCRKLDKSGCAKLWRQFETLLDSHNAQNHTVFVSEENLSAFGEDREHDYLFDFLVPISSNWNVRIIYTYRRRYESISSLYYQENDPMTVNRNKQDMVNNWPDSGGSETIPFSEYVASHENSTFKDPPEVKKRWEAIFGKVLLFNFHGSKQMLQDFFCTMIPEAPGICKLLQEKGLPELEENIASKKNLHFDMIAMEAYKRGLVKKDISRKALASAIEVHATEVLGWNQLTDFPLLHLSAIQAGNLLNHSLQIESELMPEFFASPEGKSAHEEGFLRYMETGRLASVDVDKVLHDARWIKFLRNLSK